jgi:hypothetical protein
LFRLAGAIVNRACISVAPENREPSTGRAGHDRGLGGEASATMTADDAAIQPPIVIDDRLANETVAHDHVLFQEVDV